MYINLAKSIFRNTVCNIATLSKNGSNTYLTSYTQEQKALSKFVLSNNKPSDDDIEKSNENKQRHYKLHIRQNEKNECCIMEYSIPNKDTIYCYCFNKDIENTK
jgi:hypothetical protein